MKLSVFVALAVLLAAGVPGAQAQKVFTWTDARGNLHITDEPPPAEARVRDVLEAPEVSAAEERLKDRQRQLRESTRLEGKRRSETDDVLRRAREADEEAREAVRRADDQTQRALEYRKRFGNTPARREQFKYKIRAEEDRAEAARTEAQIAIDRAKALSDEAKGTASPP